MKLNAMGVVLITNIEPMGAIVEGFADEASEDFLGPNVSYYSRAFKPLV